MAYEDKVIDITAEELEATVKEKVPSLDEKVLKLERIPQYIKTNIDWNYNEDSTAISVQFGKDGESNNLYIRIAGTTGKPDSFGDLTDATAYDIRLERLVDTDDSIQDWSLSENVSDEELTLFRYISIRVATFWRNSNNEIVGFCAYGNENLLEQYILPLQAEIDSKKDMFYIAETSSLIDESDEYGNSFLDVKVDSVSENSTLQKDENGRIAVNTDVIPTQDDLAKKANSNEVANAIKGNATGTAIAFNDVSPLPHKTQIKGTANTQLQVVKGINLFKYAYDIGYSYNSASGLTTVINDDFVVHTQGTLTSASNVVILPNIAKKQILFPAGTYYFYADVSGTNTGKFVANLKVYDSNNVYKTLIQIYANTEKSVTFDYPFYLSLGALGGRTNCAVGDEFDMDIKLIMTVARGHEYEPAKYDTVDGYTLDDNGMLEISAISPSMTILADDEVAIEYNKDASKLVNRLLIDNENLKNAVTALGGTI